MTETCKHGHHMSCRQCHEEAYASKTQAPLAPFVATPPKPPVSALEWRAARARARRASR